MSTEQDGWIRFVDQKPGALPKAIWCCNIDEPRSMTLALHGPYDRFTHWKPADLPPPPKPEPTQVEVDRDAFYAWKKDLGPSQDLVTPEWAWEAALAWEREQVRALIERRDISSEQLIGHLVSIVLSDADWRALAARVGLQP